jgi:hemoglobin-like flavoprotein
VSLSEKLEKAIEPFMKQYGPYKDKREDLGKQYKQEQPLVTWETYLKKHLGKEVKKMDKIAEKHVSFEITVEEANFVKDFWYKTLLERLPTFTPKQAVLAYAEAFHIG